MRSSCFTFQQRAKLIAKRLELTNLAVDFLQVVPGYLLHMTTGFLPLSSQSEQRLYFSQRYAERLRTLYKQQQLNRLVAITPVPIGSSIPCLS